MSEINPYDSLPERLHNCPNCGGTLQDDGKCRFCGSVVYDFLGIDLDNHTPTFIRMRHNGKIIHFKVLFTDFNITMSKETPVVYFDNEPMYLPSTDKFDGSIDFTVTGDIIVEDPKITGVGG